MNKKYYDIKINISPAYKNSTEVEIENYCRFIFDKPIIGCFSNIASDGLIIKRYVPRLMISVFGSPDVFMTVPLFTTRKKAIKISNELYTQFVYKYNLYLNPTETKNKELNNKIGFIN